MSGQSCRRIKCLSIDEQSPTTATMDGGEAESNADATTRPWMATAAMAGSSTIRGRGVHNPRVDSPSMETADATMRTRTEGGGDDPGQRGTCRRRKLRVGAARGEEGADGVGLRWSKTAARVSSKADAFISISGAGGGIRAEEEAGA
jgi:hypothetical protein